MSEGRLVARNMAYLTAAQVLTIPLSVGLNLLYARYLGPRDFGLIYLAGTMCGFGVLVVEWGQQGVLPAMIARDRSQAGVLLGSGLAWRGIVACLVYVVLAGISMLLGRDGLFQWVLAACFVQAVWTSLAGAYKDSIRGFERTDIPAFAHVAEQLLLFLIVLPLLLLGGRLDALLVTGMVFGIVPVLGLSLVYKRVGIGELRVRRKVMAAMLSMGTPFVFSNLALALQPCIDAVFLSKFSSQEAVGWYSVTRRLVGVLVLPAMTLIGSLYPTLCRLWEETESGYLETTRDAVKGITLLAVPAALGCALYPEVGVALFGERKFGPAEDNLRVMSMFLFLVYFSMPFITAVLAAGKRRAWTIVQLLCVAAGLLLDPFLISWFQKNFNNGGLGLCVATVVTESLVIVAAVFLMPRGVLNRSVLRTMMLAALSGIPMVGVAVALKGKMSPLISAPIAVAAYVVAAVLTGAITSAQLREAGGLIMRKLMRFT
jgi:O-antigen/teichoic acid export membrane protein